jgi:hypothetical protein
MTTRFEILCAILACLAGCGYFMSGTWEDDPGNWDRAFGTRKPEDVVVLHSKYSRFPHFTYECEYFFEIRSNPGLKQELISQNKLVRPEGGAVGSALNDLSEAAPRWFAPKPMERYELWTIPDDPFNRFRVLVDKESGNLFLADLQL